MCQFLKQESKGGNITPLCSFTNKECPYASYCQYIKGIKFIYNWKTCSYYINYWNGKTSAPKGKNLSH